MPTRLELFMGKIDRAMAADSEGNVEAANRIAREAAEKNPDAWIALGCEYLSAKDWAAAEKIFAQALTITKDPVQLSCALNNLGMIANERGDRRAAFEFFELAREQEENAMVCNNIGLYHFWNGDVPLASQWFQRALDHDPHFAEAEFHMALLLLKIGDWREGWRRYESRFRAPKRTLKKLEVNRPEWDGEQPVNSLLVVAEQGYGDMIMASRLAAVVSDRGVKSQTWVVQDGLGSLLGTVRGIRAIETFDDIEHYDAWSNAMTLFHVLGITRETVPTASYIPKPPDALDYGLGFHVGIVWKGSSSFSQNIYRSSRLEDWADVLSLAGVTFHSLQVGGEDEGLIFPQLVQHGMPSDWMETARRMAALDLVISIDTGPAHLAGAMGLPLWLLLPKSAEWRWGCERDTTILYPSARLFHMDADGQWKDVLQRVADELRRMIA